MIANACVALLLAVADGDLPLRLSDQEPAPPPQAPPTQAPPKDDRRRDQRRDDDRDRDEDQCIVTISGSGRASFPLGSMREGTTTSTGGSRIAYEDLFHMGWGADAEISFLVADWGGDGRNDDHHDGHHARHHWLGFYLSGQWDRFNGDSVSLSSGGTLAPDKMEVVSAFAGFKHHVPWGGGLFHEVRVGGGFIHYSNVDASVSGTPVRLFDQSWGVAAEAGLRLGWDFRNMSIFVAGVGRAGEGPQESSGLPFPASTSTFFTAAAEVGLEFKF